MGPWNSKASAQHKKQNEGNLQTGRKFLQTIYVSDQRLVSKEPYKIQEQKQTELKWAKEIDIFSKDKIQIGSRYMKRGSASLIIRCCIVQLLSCVWLFMTPWTADTRPPCPSPTPGVYSKSCPSSRWYHPAISSPVVPFSSCPQSLPASGFFPMSQLFARGGQSIGVSASASVLPVNTQDWSPLGWTGWISLQSKGVQS